MLCVPFYLHNCVLFLHTFFPNLAIWVLIPHLCFYVHNFGLFRHTRALFLRNCALSLYAYSCYLRYCVLSLVHPTFAVVPFPIRHMPPIFTIVPFPLCTLHLSIRTFSHVPSSSQLCPFSSRKLSRQLSAIVKTSDTI